MTRFDLVIFDLDGVLADSEVLCAPLFVDQLAKYDVKLDEAYVYRNFVGKSFSHVVETIRQEFETDLPACFESDFSETLLAEFSAHLQPTEGIHEVLAVLGPAACVATSSSPTRASHTLKIIGLEDYFGHHVYTASQVAKGKPAPDLFLFAAQSMGVAPSRCLVLEDSAAGVQAALAAQMQVWRYVGGGHFLVCEKDQNLVPIEVNTFQSWRQFYKMAPDLKE